VPENVAVPKEPPFSDRSSLWGAECLSEACDCLRDAVVADRNLAPRPCEQRFLGHNLTGVRRQKHKHIHVPIRQPDSVGAATQDPARRIELEWTKTIDIASGRHSNRPIIAAVEGCSL